MDSLLASYVSSDEEEEEEEKPPSSAKSSSKLSELPPGKPFSNSIPPPRASSFFRSLPPPKTTPSTSSAPSTPSDSIAPPKSSTSIFSSLPPPKTSTSSSSSSSSSSSLVFSSLPPPKSHRLNPSTSEPKPKKVVQFKPPLNPFVINGHDPDDEEDDKKKKESKPIQSSSSSLFSIMPPPKNSLCLAPSASSASARRSVVEADVAVANPEVIIRSGGERDSLGNPESVYAGGSVVNHADGQLIPGLRVSGDGSSENYVGYEGNVGYEGYVSYENYPSHAENWDYPSTTTMRATETLGGFVGKRGRNEIPVDIVEVKQDELIKNRPREDQVKLTGIAFGPSYQPASSKGKPSKLHKRKHQIGALFYDMKQKEMELAERRSKGMLTKRETQGKYGW